MDLVRRVFDGLHDGSIATDVQRSNLVVLICEWAGACDWDMEHVELTESLTEILDLLYSQALVELSVMSKDTHVNVKGCTALMSLVHLQRVILGIDDVSEFPMSRFLYSALLQFVGLSVGYTSLFSEDSFDANNRLTEFSSSVNAIFKTTGSRSASHNWLRENIKLLQ